MCGRITQDLNLKTLFTKYRISGVGLAPNLAVHYNGCPTQNFAVVRGESDGRAIAKLRWGLA